VGIYCVTVYFRKGGKVWHEVMDSVQYLNTELINIEINLNINVQNKLDICV